MTVVAPLDDADTDLSVEHGHATPNGVELHYVTAGPPDGDLLVCLHGFPECWYTWKHQIPVLADDGYRVVALDMRGANRSGKPDGVSAYGPAHLATDVAELIAHFDRERAHVVGHDFGGLAAWHLAAKRPQVVDRLAILNSPNLAVYDRHLRSSLTQLRKAWYVFFFQLPRLPEYLLSSDDYGPVASMYRDRVAGDAITAIDVDRFRQAVARDGALHAMVNWYRAMGRWYRDRLLRREGFADLDVTVPTMLLWGENDHALSVDLIDDHRAVVEDLQIERYPDASHWVQFDAREQVNEALLTFLSDEPART